MRQGQYSEVLLEEKRIVPALERFIARLRQEGRRARWLMNALEIRTRPLKLICEWTVVSPEGEGVEERGFVLDNIREELCLEVDPTNPGKAVLLIGETIALVVEQPSLTSHEVIPTPPPIADPTPPRPRATLLWEDPPRSDFSSEQKPTPRPDDHNLRTLFEQALKVREVLI